jgi:FMN phosphatase YigB (HAD superfamily)
MITALLFDFGGTLDGPLHWLDRFLVQYRDAGVEISRDELDHAFDHATRAGYRTTKIMQRFGLAELVRFHAGNQVEFLAHQGPERVRARLTSMDSKGRHRLVEQITAGFVRTTREGMQASRAVVATLKRRFRIGVISNFYGNLDRILQEAQMSKIIDSITDSSRVGIFKPDPAIYQAALRSLTAAADTCAMIGDSLGKDCAPAHRLGMKTVWYRSSESVHPNGGAKPGEVDFTISSLDELPGLRW